MMVILIWMMGISNEILKMAGRTSSGAIATLSYDNITSNAVEGGITESEN